MCFSRIFNSNSNLTMKRKLITFVSIAFIAIYTIGCGSNTETNNTDNKEVADEFAEAEDDFGQTFYRIPAPEEMFTFVKSGNLNFASNLLNPTSNLEKYIDTRAKELNFGVYAADLAYSAAFHEFQGSLQYIDAIKKLSEAIEISAIFNDGLNGRIKNIFAHQDTLVNVTNSTYNRIVNHLEANDRGKTLALISAGGWLESIYIVTNLVSKYDAKNPTIQQIADQKLTFENLMLYLEQYKSDPAVQQTIDDLQGIAKVFSQLEVEKIENANTGNTGEVILLGAGSKIKITKEQFDLLKSNVNTARNKITGNTSNA